MVCRTGLNIVACGPPRVYRRRLLECRACERRHWFVESWDGAWYGTTLYGSCGDRWQDGEMCPRPFQRGWRDEARERFRALWAAATTPSLWRAYAHADTRTAIAQSDGEIEAAYDARDRVLRRIAAQHHSRPSEEGSE